MIIDGIAESVEGATNSSEGPVQPKQDLSDVPKPKEHNPLIRDPLDSLNPLSSDNNADLQPAPTVIEGQVREIQADEPIDESKIINIDVESKTINPNKGDQIPAAYTQLEATQQLQSDKIKDPTTHQDEQGGQESTSDEIEEEYEFEQIPLKATEIREMLNKLKEQALERGDQDQVSKIAFLETATDEQLEQWAIKFDSVKDLDNPKKALEDMSKAEKQEVIEEQKKQQKTQVLELASGIKREQPEMSSGINEATLRLLDEIEETASPPSKTPEQIKKELEEEAKRIFFIDLLFLIINSAISQADVVVESTAKNIER